MLGQRTWCIRWAAPCLLGKRTGAEIRRKPWLANRAEGLVGARGQEARAMCLRGSAKRHGNAVRREELKGSSQRTRKIGG